MNVSQTFEWCVLTRVRNWDGSVILTHGDHTIRLSESAEIIWRTLCDAPTLPTIASRIAAEFGISTSEASLDAATWLAEMVEAGFIVSRDRTQRSAIPVCSNRPALAAGDPPRRAQV